MSARSLSLSLSLVLTLLAAGPALADEWEAILDHALRSPYSQTRHNGLKGVDTSTAKGLKTLWKVLAQRDARNEDGYEPIDWYVREGAYEAILRAEGPEAEAEIERVLKGKKNELAKEAIVQSVIVKIRKQFIKDEGRNDDKWIEDAKYRLRKTRGVDYFKLVLPACKKVDPDGKLLKRIHTAMGDKSPRVRLAAITGMMAYPHESSLPLLFGNLEGLERKRKKNYREWVLTRFALETLTGQDHREDVGAWMRWWKDEQGGFTIARRIEEEEEAKEAEKNRDPMKTVTRKVDDVVVPLETIVRGNKDGYPLMVLAWRQREPDYFRPYFAGIEEECLVYYVKMPKVGDFKGLKRDATSNLVQYPRQILAKAVAGIMEEAKLERFGVLGHGPASSALAMQVAAENQKMVSHLILINPRSGASEFGDAIDGVINLGKRHKIRELEKGGQNILIGESTGRPLYEPADSDEAGGLGRALANLRFSDPTDPVVGSFDYLYEDGDSAQTLADTTWRAIDFYNGDKPRLPALVIMGTKSPWTPKGDMQKVASLFPGSSTVEFPKCGEFPFMFEPYKFNTVVRKFLHKANKSLKASAKKRKKKKRGR